MVLDPKLNLQADGGLQMKHIGTLRAHLHLQTQILSTSFLFSALPMPPEPAPSPRGN